ncbi:molybdopterin-guanine dinucleotide biosynthesis protein A, MobA [Methanothermus fervidus DSM 2088]|uniref:Probable molybdenum cofactor guanylyltransferase n=1 Tax=Methanothermus fervidus (strain ATCC 43054 / DSM 2088 / JCM 10308 / V24 S) TaxID=523846 RepID=E3GXG4_METFV|nr:molybdenum cofactor guanylyltransferase [Methanothermus fervidus]ADP76996.1 molybdopterin-guanine dinucleotide biosynthesis protein A, MobA [Methanothermus fervidus DSM 2088]
MIKSAIVLCGGKSRRMGQDKGLLKINGRPMILHVINSLKNFVDEIIVVLRDEKQKNKYKKVLNNLKSLKIVTDEVKDQGPLMGIFTGLKYVKSDYSLVVPCDSPFINEKFIKNMLNFLSKDLGAEAVVPKHANGKIEPLHALYHKSVRKKIHKKITKNERSVTSFVKEINAIFVSAEELDPSLKSFKNLNTPSQIS